VETEIRLALGRPAGPGIRSARLKCVRNIRWEGDYYLIGNNLACFARCLPGEVSAISRDLILIAMHNHFKQFLIN
jgi:hypothetical protein